MYGLGKGFTTPVGKEHVEHIAEQHPSTSEIQKEADEVKKIERIKQSCPLIVAFRNQTILADIIFRSLHTSDLIKLRSTCHDLYEIVLRYVKDIIQFMPFMSKAVDTELAFWFPALNYFMNIMVELRPINRLSYPPVVNALKLNKTHGFPIGKYQMRGHCVATLDNLLPSMIQTCDHELPKRHTCSLDRFDATTSKSFSDPLEFSDFLMEYRERIGSVNSDELVWMGQPYAAYLIHIADIDFIVLLFETFLKGLQEVMALRAGRLLFRRTEFLSNVGALLRHRIWLQITASWGWEDGRPLVRKKEGEALKKADATTKKVERKKWVVKTVGAQEQRQQITKPVAKTKAKGAAKTDPTTFIPRGNWPAIYFTLMDHWQWDA